VPRYLYGLAVVIVLTVATCSHPTTGLLKTDDPYTLRTINGQLLPYAVNGTANGPQITAGSITFFGDHSAQRAQQGRRPNGTGMADTRWTQPATFHTQIGRVVLTYQGWPTPQGGPNRAADTLVATKSGAYVLHDGGLTLLFCRASDC
jgi:hypothetical protein